MAEQATAEKQSWNSLERTKLFVSSLTPLTVCVIGLIATDYNEQSKKIERSRATNTAYDRAVAEHNSSKDHDITKTLVERLRQVDACRHEPSLKVLISMATPRRAESLYALYSDQCRATTTVEQRATEAKAVLAVAKMAELDSVLSDFQTTGRHAARDRFRVLFETDEDFVAPRLAREIKDNFNDYQATLGALVVLGSVNRKWKYGGALGTQFAALTNSPNMTDPTFSDWYKKAKARMAP